MPPVSNTEPRNGPTRILTAAVWLKLSRKYFNEGTAKEACERFQVRAKQLPGSSTNEKYQKYGFDTRR